MSVNREHGKACQSGKMPLSVSKIEPMFFKVV